MPASQTAAVWTVIYLPDDYASQMMPLVLVTSGIIMPSSHVPD